jgi:transposase
MARPASPAQHVSVEDNESLPSLYVSFELGDKQWKLTFADGRQGHSRYTVSAGEKTAVLHCIRKAKAHFGLPSTAPVRSCYEAGRDGWWLHRWLRAEGVSNVVVDSTSIEVNRRARRAKTDRLDGDKLLALLLRYHAGERRVWSVVREPSAKEEDGRRTHRELARMTKERTAHTNRVGSLLVLHNLRPTKIGGRDWQRWWAENSSAVPPALRAEIEREIARLELVKQQAKALEAARLQEIREGKQPLISRLLKLRAIGIRSAWLLDKELFGWRRFANRRELAGCLGLTPTPYASGITDIEQGISKAGNRRARALLVDLAWGWLRLQPRSALSQWFARRFANGGRRMRRVGIVAVARKLAIALWRFIEHGQMPPGATLKPNIA